MSTANGGPPTYALTALDDGVTAPYGFSAAGITAGLKPSGRPDLAIVVADEVVSATAVLTTNHVKAAPVLVTAEHLGQTRGRARAVLLNAGSANACTGPAGLEQARAGAAAAADALGCAAEEVLVCSTGVIGEPIPEPYLGAIPQVVAAANSVGGAAAAEAIMTTDLVRKEAAVHVTDTEGGSATVGGMCKGSGMIAPSLATMLCVVTTDAPLDPLVADGMLRRAVRTTFNAISVDGVMSTNDAIVLLASGTAVTPPDDAAVEAGITAVLADLAEQVVRDGEGAEHLVRLRVQGTANDADAMAIARQVAGDSLVKTAIAGNDPNWGRVIAAVGAAGVDLDQDAIDITIAGHRVCTGGAKAGFDRDATARAMQAQDVEILIDLNDGEGRATFLTCDLTHGYITINAEYTT